MLEEPAGDSSSMSARNVDIAGTERIAKRRHRSKLERRRIVEESLEPGASVAVIARAHGVNANLEATDLRTAGTELMPVRIIEGSGEARPAHLYSGAIQIELGRARLRIEGSVDPDTLRSILQQLSR
jgi:transposase